MSYLHNVCCLIRVLTSTAKVKSRIHVDHMHRFQKCTIAARPYSSQRLPSDSFQVFAKLFKVFCSVRAALLDLGAAQLPLSGSQSRNRMQGGTCGVRHQTHAEASSSRTLPDMAYLQRTTFAQALMERAWMTEKEAKKLLQDITGSADGTVIP